MTSKLAPADNKLQLGFWLYLMTDCVLFATLFATYAVLRNNTNGGAAGGELFSLPYVLVETMLLLTSSFTCGLALLMVHARRLTPVLIWLGVTFLLGVGFLTLETYEFHTLLQEGNSWTSSGFLSAFYTLVGTHGLHIFVGLVWLIVLANQLVRKGFTDRMIGRLTIFSMFWHLLDIVWIFIFTSVYLLGAI